MSLLLIAAAALACAAYGPALARWLLERARVFWKSSAIPGPRSGVLRFAGPMEQLVDNVRAAVRQYGNTVRIYAWPVVCIFISEPEDLEAMFNSPHMQSKPPIVYDSLSPILGVGLATLNGDTHRRHRKAIGPSLHLEILQGFVPIFEKNALKLCKQMDHFARTGGTFDAVPMLGRYSAKAICETVFSAEVSPGLEAEQENFIKILIKSSEMLFYRVMRPWYSIDALFYFSSGYNEYQAGVQGFESFVSKTLAHKIDLVNRGVPLKEGKRKAFLDHFLSSNEAQVLSQRDLIEELKTLSAGAVGTSMDLMSFFLSICAIMPDVQDKIAKELDDVFGASDRPVEAGDLSHLRYLECCIKETLRLFPPLFSFSRTVMQDVKLPSGHVLPQGSIAAIMPYITHRNPQHFTDPEKFDPTRFFPENCRDRHPYAYIPFSAGARNCIGQRYAMMSAKVLASEILRRFRVLPAPNGPKRMEDFKMMAGVTLGLKDGAPLTVERRQKSDRRGSVRG